MAAHLSISGDKPPLIIAELSGNHNGSLDRALHIIEEAAKAGADAIKFQTYTADTMTMDCTLPDFRIEDSKSLWNGRGLYDLYQEAHTPWAWHAEMFACAKKNGIIPFSTPFDDTAVDYLETLGAEVYKIASFEMTHLPLIEKVAKTGKPIIMSTGMASEEDIKLALNTAREAGAKDITLLKCTSAYPADARDANLATIPDMAKKFGVKVGLSDHSLGIGVAIASVVYGAVAIEKHFTLARADGGVDSAFSIEPHELRQLKEESVRAWQARGKVIYGSTENEKNSRQFQQSVWPRRNIRAGERFSAENLKICRPGFGLKPRHYKELLGKSAARDLAFGERILLNDAKD